MFHNRTVLTAAVLLACVIVFAGNCKKAIPVQELSAARSEIALAQGMNAEEHAAEEFAQARESLLGAHQNIADEKYDDAKKMAMAAESQARDARLKSAPKNVLAGYKNVVKAKNEADVAAADQLAKDEYNKAMESSREGVALTKDAREKEKALAELPAEAAPEEKVVRQKAVLAAYAAASGKFEESNAGFDRAKKGALARRGDLLNSVGGIDQKIKKAETFGAAEVQPDLLKQARSESGRARASVQGGNLRDGIKQIASSQKMADDLLAKTLPAFAEKKKAEADEVVKMAGGEYDALAGKGGMNADDSARMKGIEENLAAAREALGSSEKNYSARKYEESINESQEAIRLAAILREQMSPIAERMAKVQKPVVASSEAGTYTVQKNSPAESLWRIAGKKGTLNNPFLWVKVYEANKDKIGNPNLIFPGQTLVIPGAKGTVKVEGRGMPKTEKKEKKAEKKSEMKAEKKVEKKMQKIETLKSQPRENVR